MDKVTANDHTNSTIGMAVFASGDIQPDEVVITSRAIKELPKRGKYSLEIDRKHILISEPGVLVNHSCSPNCRLEPNEQGGVNFISVKTIFSGEEITFDYESNESEITDFEACYCGAELCRKKMNSRKYNQ